MESDYKRKQQSFRLRADVIDRLKEKAVRANRSLNNYVESVLISSLEESIPNTLTFTAIDEAKKGNYAGSIDTSSTDAMIRSIDS